MSFISYDHNIDFDPGDPPEADEDPLYNIIIEKKDFDQFIKNLKERAWSYRGIGRGPSAIILDWRSFLSLKYGIIQDRIGWVLPYIEVEVYIPDIDTHIKWGEITVYPDLFKSDKMIVVGG